MNRILIAYDRHHTLEPAVRAASPNAFVRDVDARLDRDEHITALVIGLPGSVELDRKQRTHDKVNDMIQTHEPDFVMWENVRGLNSMRHEATLQAYLNAVIDAGYYTAYRTLDASRFGAERPSKRVWILGTRRTPDLPIHPRWPSRRNRPHVYAPAADPVALAILQANL